MIKTDRLAYVVDKGNFGTIQYRLSARSVSAWADKKERELDTKLLSSNEGSLPGSNLPSHQPTYQPTNPPTKQATEGDRPAPSGILDRIRSEAAKWKGKYEVAIESLAHEREDRRAAEDRVSKLAYELGGAKREVKMLEEKLALLMAPKGTENGGLPTQDNRPAA